MPDETHARSTVELASAEFDVRAAHSDDLYGAAVARVASWRAAFTGLVPQDFLDAMDPAKIAACWAESITAGRSRAFYRRYGFTETPDRTHSSVNNLPELRLRLDTRRPEHGSGDRAET